MVNARHIFQPPRMGAKASIYPRRIIRDIGRGCVDRQCPIGEAIHQQQCLEVHENAITPKGARKQEEAKMLWEQQQQGIMDTLGAKQTAELNAMLDKAIELLKAANNN